jgi:hypothetical protein
MERRAVTAEDWRSAEIEPILRKAMRILAFVTIVGLAAGSVAPLHGQSLVDVAKKEEERRKDVKGGAKVYTNGDLKSAPGPSPDPISAAAASADPPTSADKKAADAKPDGKGDAKGDEKAQAKDAKASAKGDVKDQEYWHGRMKALTDQLERDRLYAEALQTRVNSLTTDFSSRDDPAQRALISEDRDKAITELSRLRKQIEEDKDAIGMVEEEARQAAVPPGWLR